MSILARLRFAFSRRRRPDLAAIGLNPAANGLMPYPACGSRPNVYRAAMQPSPPFFLVLRLKIANGWPRQAYERRHSSRRYTHISAEPQPRGLSMVGPRVSPRSYELLQPVACRCWPPHPCHTNRNRVACRWSAPACCHVIPQCTLKARWGSPRRHPVRRPAAGPPLNAAANAANIAAERVPCLCSNIFFRS